MQVWDKRYQDGVSVEWYCGFDHVRPLFERFIPKVCPILVGIPARERSLQKRACLNAWQEGRVGHPQDVHEGTRI